MAISDHLQEFAGKPVENWTPEGLSDPANVLPRLALEYDDHDQNVKWTDKFSEFLEHSDASQVTGLVIGAWDYDFSGGDSSEVVEAVVAARERLPKLTALFFGDITYEECEMSWIQQSDVSPLFEAFPLLETFGVRGGNNLSFGALRHDKLRHLAIQTGGMDAEIARSVFASQLPALQRLELWLGDSGYGATLTADDLAPLLNGELFPHLRELGLRNAQIADELARVVADAPILKRLDVLDLSLGALTNEGAEALLESPGVRKLRKLDIHHHFCSPECVEKLRALNIEVNADDPQKADEYDGIIYRYIAVGE